MNVKTPFSSKQQPRLPAKTSYITQTYIQLCPNLSAEAKYNRTGNNRSTTVKRTLYKMHHCSLGKTLERETQLKLFQNLATASGSMLNKFLISEKFKLQTRQTQPLLVTDELLNYIKNKSTNYSKGNPHVICQTPQLRISMSQDKNPKLPLQKKEIPSSVIEDDSKSQQLVKFPQKSQTFSKKEIFPFKKNRSFCIKTSEGPRQMTASTTLTNFSHHQGKLNVIHIEQKSKNKPLINHDWRQLRSVKSQSYAIMEYPSGQLIMSYRAKQSLEIASLTKMMTCYLIIKLAETHQKDLTLQTHTIGQHIEESTGTTAELIDGDCYTIEQLLYGLMLPSGNDAALALADWGGSLITKSKNHWENIRAFVGQMNMRAISLGLKNTRYGNPHGLPSRNTRSTALDMCLLANYCLSIPLFTKIVSTKYYKTKIYTTDNINRVVEWQNTNKLLRRQGFIGIKTGITVTAGPCLASAYNFRNKTYIIILLRANKVSRRFTDTRIILSWTLKTLYKNEMTPQQRKQIDKLTWKDRDFDSDNSEDEEQFQYQRECTQEYARRNLILTYQL